MCNCGSNSEQLPIGSDGATGPVGLQGPIGPIGLNGQSFGIRLTPEAPGSNCATGGTKIETGPDYDNNGDPDSITQTYYICNGATGSQASIPFGIISLFYGSMDVDINFDINGLGVNNLDGWALCNGNNFTPDMRGLFIVGYDDRTIDPSNGYWDSAYNTPGSLVGQPLITLAKGNIPKHQHVLNNGTDNATQSDPGNHTHTVTIANLGSGSDDTPFEGGNSAIPISAPVFTTSGAGAHRHTGSTGNGSIDGLKSPPDSIDNRPKTIVMAYIMKL